MPTPTYTPPPTPPTRGDATTFSARVAAFLAWIVTFVGELITATAWFSTKSAEVAAASAEISAAALVAADAAGLVARSTTTVSVGAGSKSFHFVAPKPALAVMNRQVAAMLLSDNSIFMIGTITATDGTDDITLTVVSGGVSGAGDYSDWQLIDAGFLGKAATVAEIRAGISDVVAISPKGQRDAQAPVALTPGSTVTPNLVNGRRFTLTASASFTLANPTNCRPGDPIEITVTNAAGSIVMAVGNAWKRQNSIFILDPASGRKNKIAGVVETVDGSGNATEITYNGQRNPVN